MAIGRTERPQALNAVVEPDRLMSQLASSVETYWISGSPFAWRVLLTAEVKGIPYEERLLQASKGELKAPDFLAINPLGRVPALRDAAPGSPRAADGRSVSACGPALRRAPVGPCVIERMEARALAADRRKDVEQVPRRHGCDVDRSPPTPSASASCVAYNLGNFLRTQATPDPIKDWSLTSLQEKLIKIGAKVSATAVMSLSIGPGRHLTAFIR
jgi:hypothetical protein